jgi:SanA protein
VKRRIKVLAVATLALGLTAVLGAGSAIRKAAQGRIYADAAAIPYRKVGLLLGCSQRLPDGRRNLFFSCRVSAAASLFRAHRVDYFIVSGDNHVVGYDEATDMKVALAKAGVPAERVYCDYAGFRTLDSVVRAREIFGQTSLTVISQEFHNQRAIYIARHKGMDAIGFNAPDVGTYHGFRTQVREWFARVKTVLDVRFLGTRPRFLGPRIEIGGRAADGGQEKGA